MLNAFKKLPLAKQAQILDAAAIVFAEQGYHFSSIANICKVAGISNGALYRYFENKEALFFAVIDRCANLLGNELFTKTWATNSIYDDICNILLKIEEFSVNSRVYLSIYSDLGSSSINFFASKASAKIEDDAHKQWVQIIEAGKLRGEIDKSIESNTLAFFIDNYVMLFIYSLVSEYHNRRFASYFSSDRKYLEVNEKINIIMESIEILLKGKTPQ